MYIKVARFFVVQYTKTGKIYQNGENIPKRGKYTKNITNNHNVGIPNDNKIYQSAIKYTK
jgi:hypothetical protein